MSTKVKRVHMQERGPRTQPALSLCGAGRGMNRARGNITQLTGIRARVTCRTCCLILINAKTNP